MSLCLFNYLSPAGRRWRAILTLTDTAWRHWERSLSLFVSSALCPGLYPFYKQQGFLYLCNTLIIHIHIYIVSFSLSLRSKWPILGWASLCATLVCYSMNGCNGCVVLRVSLICICVDIYSVDLMHLRVICLFFLFLRSRAWLLRMVQNMEINVSFLTDSEQEFILEVLRRDEELRRLEELRVKWVFKAINYFWFSKYPL